MHDIQIMTDIETLDTEETAEILQIGIVAFSLSRREILSKALLPLNIEMQTDRTRSKETLAWWDNQPNKAEVFGLSEKQGIRPEIAANTLNFIFKVTEGAELWSKGHFDYPLLGNFLYYYTAQTPWKYSRIRDMRTLLKYAESKGFTPTTPQNNHNALEDALNQVHTLFQIDEFFTKTGGTK